MVKCPACGESYQNTLSLLKHVRLKSKYDEKHESLWLEYINFKNSNNGFEGIYTETDMFREFLRRRASNNGSNNHKLI